MLDDIALITATLLAGLTTLAWAVQLARLHAVGRDFPELGSGDHPKGSADDAPRVTVVMAAKDEEDEIEAAVRSILAQDHPDLHLVVVDDRSRDDTPRILERLATEHAERMRVVTIEELPPGWGGQNHALHRGVLSRSGEADEGDTEWLCFTDADCRLDAPDTISVALSDARAHGAELFSMLPRMDTPTLWERIYLPLCSLVLLVQLRIAEVNDRQSDAGYANGAFILIRRDAYDRLGGHERVRHFVNDDVRLAELAKREGVALRVVGNRDLLRTRMYESFAGAFRGWSRNFWGTLRSPRKIAMALFVVVGLFLVPWSALALSLSMATAVSGEYSTVALAWSVPVLVSHVGLLRLYGAFSLSPFWSLFYVPGALFVAAILASSLMRALSGRGATWEGAHYAQPSERDRAVSD